MSNVTQQTMIRKTTLIAMAVAGVFATMPTQAKNIPDAQFAFSWDGNEVLVNDNVSGATEKSFTRNDDGSITGTISGITVENKFPNGVLGNYAKTQDNTNIYGKDLVIKNSSFENNGTHFDGNVLHLTVSGATGTEKYSHRIEGSTFKNNNIRAVGLIYEADFKVISEMTVVNSHFENNHAGEGGSHVYRPVQGQYHWFNLHR